MKNFSKVVLSCVVVLAVGACSSKKKTDDSGVSTNQPQIDSTAMSFAPNGSDSGQISGLVTIHFDYDKSALSADTKKDLKGNADWVKSHNVKVQIEGHCDSRGSIEYNLALGERRAKAVKDYLVKLGVSEDKLSTISYGKEKPIATGDSDADMAKNRRANFLPL